MKKMFIILLAALLITATFAGCSSSEEQKENDTDNVSASNTEENEPLNSIVLTDEITELADGFSAVRHSGDYGFDLFLEQGGATSDSELGSFLMDNLMPDISSLLFSGNPFGCSTLSVQNANGDRLFGRNFDWNNCNAMIVQNKPDNGYACLDIKTPLNEWISAVKEFKPNMIIGYPSAIKILAELAEKGDADLHIRRVVSCGEPLGANLRKYMEDIFGAQVINFYGASESLSLGVESDPQEGMLLFDDMNIIEIENGEMYLTCLYNFVQPLIRYRISDSLTLEKPSKDNHYPFTRAVGLLGRNEDILWFNDGNGKREFLHPLAIEGFCIPGLLDYQFRKFAPDAFEMMAEVADDSLQEEIRSEMLRQMKAILEEKELGYVQFYVNFVPEIIPDPKTGKKRLIITEAAK